MNKQILLALAALFATSASTLMGQFSALAASSSDDHAVDYAQLINDEGWANRITDWQPASLPRDFDPFGTMTVVFIGESTNFLNNLSIQFGDDAGDTYTPFSIPEADIAPGNYICVAMQGQTSFDFWLTLPSNYSKSAPSTTVWSLFNPGSESKNPLNVVGKSTVREVDGETYHLYSFQNGSDPLKKTGNTDNLRFFVHYSSEQGTGTPFTAVPEPSTYGMIGTLLLMALIGGRRLRKIRK